MVVGIQLVSATLPSIARTTSRQVAMPSDSAIGEEGGDLADTIDDKVGRKRPTRPSARMTSVTRRAGPTGAVSTDAIELLTPASFLCFDKVSRASTQNAMYALALAVVMCASCPHQKAWARGAGPSADMRVSTNEAEYGRKRETGHKPLLASGQNQNSAIWPVGADVHSAWDANSGRFGRPWVPSHLSTSGVAKGSVMARQEKQMFSLGLVPNLQD